MILGERSFGRLTRVWIDINGEEQTGWRTEVLRNECRGKTRSRSEFENNQWIQFDDFFVFQFERIEKKKRVSIGFVDTMVVITSEMREIRRWKHRTNEKEKETRAPHQPTDDSREEIQINKYRSLMIFTDLHRTSDIFVFYFIGPNRVDLRSVSWSTVDFRYWDEGAIC